MRIAIVHEWLQHYAGSERVVEQFLTIFPQADLYAVVDFLPPNERAFLAGHEVRTSFIQRLPFARRAFRNYVGLMPIAVEQFDLSGYDLILSSSHAVAKGVITGPDQVHISYVHSPMRYAWDQQAQYLRHSQLDRGAKGLFARCLLHWLRMWDVRSANGVDVFVANSFYIADRIRKVYRRSAIVVHPPVDTERFIPGLPGRDRYYLVTGRFVPYKRVDLIVRAFATMPDRKLIVIGDGPQRRSVQAASAGATNIELRAPVARDELLRLMQGATAYVQAAEEDFGISVVEAQACGVPVIAFGRGGARDVVIGLEQAHPTGVLFADQTVHALTEAVGQFESAAHRIAAERCRANALRFSTCNFHAKIKGVVSNALAERAARSSVGAQANATAASGHAWLEEAEEEIL